jgi:hypothetical protein
MSSREQLMNMVMVYVIYVYAALLVAAVIACLAARAQLSERDAARVTPSRSTLRGRDDPRAAAD